MAHDINLRALALETLTEIDRGEKNASERIQSTLKNYQYLEKKERAFYSRLCLGTLEYRIQLDYYIDRISNTPIRKCKPYIRNLLRMSAYQLLYMDHVAEQVVCNEAVKLAKKKGFQNLSGFVNGVLRNLLRRKAELSLPERPKILDQKDITMNADSVSQMDTATGQVVVDYFSVTYSMPKELTELFLTWYSPMIAEKMFQAFLTESPTTLRVNLEKTTVKQLKEEIQQSGITVSDGDYCDNCLHIGDYNYLNRVNGYKNGCFTVQDESSCIQGYLIPVREIRESQTDGKQPIRILDLCASPGGKLMHACERLHLYGKERDNTEEASREVLLLGRDISEHKLSRIQENITRMEYKDIVLEVHDATMYDASLEACMDVVIADVPCSGLGVLGRKKDIKYNVTGQQLIELVALQRSILMNAVRYLKPGGYLIYSTCTVNPAENEAQVAWLQNECGMKGISIQEDLPASLIEQLQTQPASNLQRGYCTLLPGLQSCDGFFMAKMRK